MKDYWVENPHAKAGAYWGTKMRNPARIKLVLDKLAELWAMQPDTRFGQLIYNLSRSENGAPTDIFVPEDTFWLKCIESHIERLKSSRPDHVCDAAALNAAVTAADNNKGGANSSATSSKKGGN